MVCAKKGIFVTDSSPSSTFIGVFTSDTIKSKLITSFTNALIRSGNIDTPLSAFRNTQLALVHICKSDNLWS